MCSQWEAGKTQKAVGITLKCSAVQTVKWDHSTGRSCPPVLPMGKGEEWMVGFWINHFHQIEEKKGMVKVSPYPPQPEG